jgi:hypothetical protein
MIGQKMTLIEIRNAGFEALVRELGVVGMVRFLQQYETGKGDYSRERHAWLDTQNAQTIASKIFESREG